MFNLYAPFHFIFPMALTALPLALLLPSKGAQIQFKKDSPPEQDSLLSRQSPSDEIPDGGITESSDSISLHSASQQRSTLQAFRDQIRRKVKLFAKLFFRVQLAQFGALALFVVTLGKQSLHILVQYASKHFGITVASAGYLLSVKAIVNLVLFIVVLPVARGAQRRTMKISNALLARISIGLLAFGTACMALSPNLPLLIISTKQAPNRCIEILIRPHRLDRLRGRIWVSRRHSKYSDCCRGARARRLSPTSVQRSGRGGNGGFFRGCNRADSRIYIHDRPIRHRGGSPILDKLG